MSESVKYKVYKISIHIFFFSYVANSKIYTIEPGKSTVLPGLKYSLITLLLGWWKFSIFHWFRTITSSLTALHINFSGGEDYTKIASESNYNQKTKWIYNNLSREVSSKLSIENLDIITELLDNYNTESLVENITYLNQSLKKINIINLFNNDLEHIISIHKRFETRAL
jgi:hypothetical protein